MEKEKHKAAVLISESNRPGKWKEDVKESKFPPNLGEWGYYLPNDPSDLLQIAVSWKPPPSKLRQLRHIHFGRGENKLKQADQPDRPVPPALRSSEVSNIWCRGL